uniref:Ester hydrolase C11orf54 homolog n=1 Tax=Cacopsylla melanoneura TaxID=428564 RepID=A0A8D8RYZ0_9HEMI
MSVLKLSDLSVEHRDLFVPPVDEVIQVLNDGLGQYFKEVSVSFPDCPDLTQSPFNLTSAGLCGSPSLVEYGGASFLEPIANKFKIYDLKNLFSVTQTKPTFAVGAGAGSWRFAGTNCEGVFDVTIDSNQSCQNGTRIAKITNRDVIDLLKPANEDTTFALLASFYCSQGLQGKVIKIRVHSRTSKEDFVTSVRSVLAAHYKDQPVGLGGVILIEDALAKHHVMPDFSTTPLETKEQLNEWLVFKDLTPPLISVGTLISSDVEGLDLRLQHFHSFNHHNQGGHYHYDVNAETVTYTAYLNLASRIHRVDKPL